MKTQTKKAPTKEEIKYAYSFVEWHIKDKLRKTPLFKKYEGIIAQDAEHSYYYALFLLKAPFPAGEAAIAMDEAYSKRYKEFLEKFKKGEIK